MGTFLAKTGVFLALLGQFSTSALGAGRTKHPIKCHHSGRHRVCRIAKLSKNPTHPKTRVEAELKRLNPKWEEEMEVKKPEEWKPSRFKNVSWSSDSGLLMADVNYPLKGSFSPFSLDAKVAVNFNSAPFVSNDHTFDMGAIPSFGYGITANYDIPLIEQVTLGPKLSYLVLTQNTPPDVEGYLGFKIFLK